MKTLQSLLVILTIILCFCSFIIYHQNGKIAELKGVIKVYEDSFKVDPQLEVEIQDVHKYHKSVFQLLAH